MDLNWIAGALRYCGRIRSIKPGKSLHSHLIKLGLPRELFLANNLIAMYIDFTFLEEAQHLFEEMPDRNVVTWTTMISGYTIAGSPDKALRIFTRMSESEFVIPNSFTFSAALKACALVGNLELGESIHKCISRAKMQSDTILMNALLDMYVKCRSLGDARKVFNDICPANSTSWNTIIAGYSKEGWMEEAVNLFHQMPKPDAISWNTIIAGFTLKESPNAIEFVRMMHREGIQLDQFTFPCTLKVCGCLSSMKMGTQMHCYVVKSGFESDCFTRSALIDLYANCSGLDEATKLFDQYTSCRGTVHDRLAIWNSMLSGYVVNEHNSAALDLVSQIYRSGTPLDSYTFSSVLKVCIDLLNFRLGLQVHGLIVTNGYELDNIVGSILIDFYAKHGNIENALRLFQKLPKKDVVAWSGLIAGCAKKGSNSLVFWLFRDMVYLDIEVDQFVVSSVIKACSSLSGLEGGKQVHAYCVKSGYDSEGVTITSLIDMYSKCGAIEDGLTLFTSVRERDTVCWTVIIVGCGQNGRAKEAIGYFQEMLKSGVEPNEITYLGVLSACSHAGLVGEAWIFFKSLQSKHGLEPCMEHYCCMIDLLGRAGCFKEAERLIADMPYEPNQTIWSSLLGACRIHKNTELGNRIARHLVAISPEDPSIYVALSNIYASLGMWDASTKLREGIKEVGVKEAGKSWIVIRG